MHLSVTNMSCDGCVRAITRAIQARDPGARVSADLAARQITVESALKAAEVQALLDKAGYQAAPLDAT